MLAMEYIAPNEGGEHMIEVTFTDDVYDLFVYAAEADGWRPQIYNEQGNLVDNPQSAISRTLRTALDTIFNQAMAGLSSKRAEIARQQAISEVQALKASILGEAA